MKEIWIQIIPPIITGIIGLAGGGWFFYRHKSGAVKAKMAAEEYTDISTIVNGYTKQLGS